MVLLWGRQRLPVLVVLLLVLLPLALFLLAAPRDMAPAVAVADAITSSPTSTAAVGRELLLDARDSLCDAPDCSSCFRRPGESRALLWSIELVTY